MSERSIVELRAIGLDRLSDLRNVHTQAFKAYLGSDLSEDQLDALVNYANTTDYTDQMLLTECIGAWIDDRLCATGSWMPGGDAGASAKLTAVCVHPLFGRMGLARRIVEEIENRARRAGFSVLTARCPVTMAPFLERLGYVGTSHGVWATPCGVSVPVVHMRKGEARPDLHGTSRSTLSQRAARLSSVARLH